MIKNEFAGRRIGSYPEINIYSLADFPQPPINGVLYLPAELDYKIWGNVDLQGCRIVCLGICSILGASSETSFLTSTGLTSGALISTSYSLPIQNITIYNIRGGATVFNITGGGVAALDWQAFNLLDCNIGTVTSPTNFVVSKSFWGTCYGLIFLGTISTISTDLSLITVAAAQTFITLSATLVVNSRFRFLFSRIVVAAGAVGIATVAGVSIPNDMFILTDVGFSGAGTYITGITGLDNRSRWATCRGIQNSANSAYYYMDNNAVVTVIGAPNTFTKIAGTTTAGIIQRFTHTDNRVTYTGILTEQFAISATASGTSTGTSPTIRLQIRHYDSGGVLLATSATAETNINNANRAENMTAFLSTSVSTGDYVELWVSSSNGANVTVVSLSLMANRGG